MRRGIGIDIVELARFKQKLTPTLKTRIFTQRELDYCQKKSLPVMHLAVRFAAKEAVIKALTHLGYKITLAQIEVVAKKGNSPKIVFKNKRFKNLNCQLSLSHSERWAVAVALAEIKNIRRTSS